MKPTGPFCQSCGMPMQKPVDFGTNADGSKNDDYCSNCFRKGEFTWPNATLRQMIEKVVSFSDEIGLSKEQTRTMAERFLPHLKRWRNK